MNPDQLWQATLEQLRLRLTKITYHTWLTYTRALTLQDDQLTIAVPNQYTQDWLTFRLIRPITDCLQLAARRPITPIFTVQPNPSPPHPPLSPNAAELQAQGAHQNTLQGDYTTPYTSIVKPDKVMVFTQYFRREWWPRLGPTLSMIIMELRQRCYWNKATREKRSTCIVSQKDLAAAIGVSVATVQRALRHPDADRFILEVRPQYHYDQQLGARVRGPNLWRIRLDEPLTDEDQQQSPTRQNDV